MTDLFEEFDEFDEQSQKILMEYKDSFLDFTNIEKQEKDPFEGIRTNVLKRHLQQTSVLI